LDSYFLSPVASALVGVAIVALLFAGWADSARDLLYCGAAVILALLVFVGADRVRCQQCGAWDSRWLSRAQSDGEQADEADDNPSRRLRRRVLALRRAPGFSPLILVFDGPVGKETGWSLRTT
jgi:hypothetical protein